MAEQLDLESELRDLGTTLVVPDPPDVTARVRARITAAPGRRVRPALQLAWRWVVAFVVAALTTTLLVSPAARAAVADLFRFAGIEVQWGTTEQTPSPDAELPGEEPASLREARRLADFTIGVPSELGPPDAVTVSDSARVVSLIYGTGRDAVRLDQFDGRLDIAFVKGFGGDLEFVEVGDVDALWLDRPHSVKYVDRDGREHEESARLSGKTLIWESGGVSHRLEGYFTRDEAVAIAESMSD